MASPRSAWGIDIGNRALKAIRLSVDGGKLRVEDFEVVEHEQILSNTGDNKEAMIQSALANFVQRHDVKKVPFALSVSGQSSFARFIKLPPVEPKKIPEIVRFEAIQQIPFPLDEVEWSYHLFQAAESPDVEVGIFAMRKELVEKQIGYLTPLGMNVQVVQMSPLAVYNAMQHDERIKGTTMFIDSGAENSDLIIADGESVWLRTLPIGGNNFTETLAKSFKLNFAKAEELKRNAATSKYAKQIFQAMRPVFADLVADIQRSIGFYTAGHREAKIKRIVALGGTFRLAGLHKYLQQNLQIEVEHFDSFTAAAPSEGKIAVQYADNMLSLPTAYGLALQAIGQSKITSSVLPERIRREKMWKDKTKWFVAAASIMLVATLAAYARYFVDDKGFKDNAPMNQDIKALYSEGKTKYEAYVTEVQNKGAEDRAKILSVRSLEYYRDLWPQVLNDIFLSLPDDLKTKTPEAIKLTARAQRRIIYIEEIQSQYQPDIASLIDDKLTPDDKFVEKAAKPAAVLGLEITGQGSSGILLDDGQMSNQNMPQAATTRGFLVTIRGFTPKYDPTSILAFVQTTLRTKLEALNAVNVDKANALLDKDPQKRRQFYVSRTRIVYAGKRQFEIAPINVANGANPPPDPRIDRVTGERMDDDIEFTLLVAIVIDVPHAAPAAPGTPAAAGGRGRAMSAYANTPAIR